MLRPWRQQVKRVAPVKRITMIWIGALISILTILSSWGGANIFLNSKGIATLTERTVNQEKAIDRIDKNIIILLTR